MLAVLTYSGEYLTAESHFERALQVYQDHGRSAWETDVQCAWRKMLSVKETWPRREPTSGSSDLLGHPRTNGSDAAMLLRVCWRIMKGCRGRYDVAG